MIAGIISTYFNPMIAEYIGIGGAAFIEEPLKLLELYLMTTGRKTGYETNNHLDGMVCGAAAGAGFAALENIYYISNMIVKQGSLLLSAILFRATTSFCHIAWTATGEPPAVRDTVQGHNLLLPHSLDCDCRTVVGVGQSTKRMDTLDRLHPRAPDSSPAALFLE